MDSKEESKETTGIPASGVSTPREDMAVDLEKISEDHQEAQPVRTLRGWKWVLVLLAVYSTPFLYGLDTTIVADIQAAVVETFGEIEKLSWLGVGFPLASIATVLTIGKSYGIFNVKWMYIGSIIIFEGGSALCGGSPNMNALIVGRVIAGAGGSGIYLGVLNIVSLLTTMRERPVYMGLIGLSWGFGTIMGPVIGGAFADSSATWRWAFYINLVIVGVFAPIYIFWLPSFQPQPEIHYSQKLKQLDWLGIVLNAGVYTTWVIALTFGGATWPWNDGRTIAVFVVFGVVLIAFILSQYFTLFTTVEHRIFPGELLKRRSMILLYFGTACAATGLFVPIYYIPLYFQFVNGDSALRAAVRLLPYILLFVTFVMLNGGAMPKFGYYMPWYVFTGVTMLIGGSLMFTVDSNTSPAAVYGYSILIAVGAGSTSQAAYSVAPAKLKPQQVPSAIGFINTAQLGAIVIALTISGTIFQNLSFKSLQTVLAGQGFSVEDIHAAIAGTQSSLFETLSPDLRAAAVEAIVKAIAKVYALVIAAGAFALLTSIFLKREKLFMEAGAGGG